MRLSDDHHTDPCAEIDLCPFDLGLQNVPDSVAKDLSTANHSLRHVSVAPRKYQKILSFSVGFFCVLGWQTSLAATCFVSDYLRTNLCGTTINEMHFLGIRTTDHCPGQPWQSELPVYSMANCSTVLGNFASSYSSEHGFLSKVASYRRRCDLGPRLWLLRFYHRTLVRVYSLSSAHGGLETTQAS